MGWINRKADARLKHENEMIWRRELVEKKLASLAADSTMTSDNDAFASSPVKKAVR